VTGNAGPSPGSVRAAPRKKPALLYMKGPRAGPSCEIEIEGIGAFLWRNPIRA